MSPHDPSLMSYDEARRIAIADQLEFIREMHRRADAAAEQLARELGLPSGFRIEYDTGRAIGDMVRQLDRPIPDCQCDPDVWGPDGLERGNGHNPSCPNHALVS